MNKVGIAAFLFCSSLLFTHCSSAPTAPEKKLSAALSSVSVSNGSLVAVRIENPASIDSSQLQIEFDGQKVPVLPVREGRKSEYLAYFGVPFRQAKGLYQVKLLNKGHEVLVLPLEVTEGDYPSEVLSVNPKHVSPPPHVLPRIVREQAELKKIYATVTPRKYWDGPFLSPLESRVTSVFGSRRMYNGELKNFHSGLDLAAAVGTPIHSAASGKVVLAKDLYYTGNTVLVDHGYGLLTLYAHLSKINVKNGSEVKKGELVGLAGSTGRVTGPHLHWGAIVHHVKVNPVDLTKVIQ